MGFALLLSLIFVSSANAKDIVLKDIKTGSNKTTTRIVLELNQKVEYNIFNLKNPYRLVIDTSDFKSLISAEKIKNNKGAIRTIRTGTFSPKVSRTVIDLKFPIKIKSVRQKKVGKSTQLIIDISKSSIKSHTSQKKITSKYWNALEKKSNAIRKKEIEQLSKPIKKAGKPLIIIDAGHGGPDSGSIGVGGYYEKHITLSIAKKVYKVLKASGKFNVGLTRNRDIYIPLRTRYRIAEKRNADFFISIHADKHRKSFIRGMSIYTLSNKSSDREAAKLARKENAFDEMVSDNNIKDENSIKSILIDLTQTDVMNSASSYANSLIKIAKKNKIKLLRRPHRFAGFAVLKSPSIPSILIETGYMSNKHDIKNLKSDKWKTRFAESVKKALIIHFRNNPIK